MESATFRTALVGRVLLARALGGITVPGLTTVLREVSAARKQVGRPLLYWPILDANADIPPPEVRAKMTEATKTLLSSCESMTLIVAGHGMKSSLLRTFMRGMVRLGGHAARVRIVDSLDAAVAAANDPDISLSELLAAAQAAGIPVHRKVAALGLRENP